MTEISNMGLSKQAQDKIEQLREEYISSLPSKIKQIDRIWANVKENYKHSESLPENLREFAVICHKFAGSAGAYGLLDIANALLELESVCKSYLSEEVENKHRDIVSQLEACYRILINFVNSELRS